MSDLDLTTHPIEPVNQFVLSSDDSPYSQLAFDRVLTTAMEAYETARHQARYYEEKDEHASHEEALRAAIATAGRSYAAAALNRVVHVLADKLDEDTFLALGDTATTLDLGVVEDLDGANGTGDDH